MAKTDAAVLWAGAAGAEVEAVAARLGRRLRRRAAHRPAGAYLRARSASAPRMPASCSSAPGRT